MDIIERAIQKGLHVYDGDLLKKQTWEEFDKQKKKNHIFLFSVGAGMDYYFRNHYHGEAIDGVIDNDARKQQQELGWYCAEVFGMECSKLIIQQPEVLSDFEPDDIIVLITSVAYYKPIAEQLHKLGIKKCFSLLLMEAERRKKEDKGEDLSKIQEDFVKECCRLELKKKKIVMSIGEYGEHARNITKELLKRRKDLDIVWLVYDKKVRTPEGVRLVPAKNWKQYVYELETAYIWLFDITVQAFIVKRQGQIFIQVKHWSSITLKKFYLDDKSSCTSPEAVDWIKKNGDMMDYLLSGSHFDESACQSGFNFHGESIRIGSPRSDILFMDSVSSMVREYYRLPEYAKIILYVPTYRDKEYRSGGGMTVTLNLEKILQKVTQKLGGEWYVLVRLHPWLSFEDSNLVETNRIINAGCYEDSEELVAACDIMITDYSSIMFEAAFVKKPVFLYAPDRKEYIDGERGLLIDYDSLPFPISETNTELYNQIDIFDEGKYEKAVTDFLKRYGVHEDGHASERAADFIISILG